MIENFPRTHDAQYQASPKVARILVVDDDPTIVRLLDENLRLEGYKVSCGFDGQMGIRLARENRPDVIIMDLQMPMTNGIKAFQFLRQFAQTAQIPVIFIFGDFPKEFFPIIGNAPRIALYRKPLDLAMLNATIHQFLQKYPVSL